MKNPILMSKENPAGAKLEELLNQLIAELEAKNKKIEHDPTYHAQLVKVNNIAIIGHLQASKYLQETSMQILNTLGPNQGPLDTPRIGVDKEEA